MRLKGSKINNLVTKYLALPVLSDTVEVRGRSEATLEGENPSRAELNTLTKPARRVSSSKTQ